MEDQQEIDNLIERLNSGDPFDPDAEWKAAIALGNIRSINLKKIAVLALIEKLKRGNSHALIRAHIIESLGKLGDRQAIPMVISALQDPYRLVRAYAVAAMANLSNAETIEPLLLVLEKDDFFGARAEAAKSLGSLGSLKEKYLRQKIIDVLKKQRQVELVRHLAGAERVVDEIDRALECLEGR